MNIYIYIYIYINIYIYIYIHVYKRTRSTGALLNAQEVTLVTCSRGHTAHWSQAHDVTLVTGHVPRHTSLRFIFFLFFYLTYP